MGLSTTPSAALSTSTSSLPTPTSKAEETVQRNNLAACFRHFKSLGWDEGVANHFSLVLEDAHPQHFLVQPFGRDFGTICASELLLVDGNDEKTWLHSLSDEKNPPPIDPTAFCIHGALHRLLGPRGRCLLHLHPRHATALSALKNKVIPPLDQNTARWFNRVGIDEGFDGMGVGEEAERMAKHLGEHNALIMGNHGVLVCAETVGLAIDRMFYLEKAAQT